MRFLMFAAIGALLAAGPAVAQDEDDWGPREHTPGPIAKALRICIPMVGEGANADLDAQLAEHFKTDAQGDIYWTKTNLGGSMMMKYDRAKRVCVLTTGPRVGDSSIMADEASEDFAWFVDQLQRLAGDRVTVERSGQIEPAGLGPLEREMFRDVSRTVVTIMGVRVVYDRDDGVIDSQTGLFTKRGVHGFRVERAN